MADVIKNTNNISKKINFEEIVHIIFPLLIEYLYEPTKFKIFILNDPFIIDQKYYTYKFDLRDHSDYPIESYYDEQLYINKISLYNISIVGSGNLGCKMRYLYGRRSKSFNEFMNSFCLINKSIKALVVRLNEIIPFNNIRIKDNLNYKIFMKRFYDKHPNFYETYCQCDEIEAEKKYRDGKCNCYHVERCDICKLNGKKTTVKGSIWWKLCTLYICKICKYERNKRIEEYWEDKHERDDY